MCNVLTSKMKAKEKTVETVSQLSHLANSYYNDCNVTRIHKHLVCKQTLKHLAKVASVAKCLSVRLQTKWLLVRVPLQSLKLQICTCFEQGVS